jgi:hypothetical protein
MGRVTDFLPPAPQKARPRLVEVSGPTTPRPRLGAQLARAAARSDRALVRQLGRTARTQIARSQRPFSTAVRRCTLTNILNLPGIARAVLPKRLVYKLHTTASCVRLPKQSSTLCTFCSDDHLSSEIRSSNHMSFDRLRTNGMLRARC